LGIVEAIQAAENGKYITNNFLKITRNILEYKAKGVFGVWAVEQSGSLYPQEEKDSFTTAEVLSIGWEIVTNKTFENTKDIFKFKG
jgi:hypothetical protein